MSAPLTINDFAFDQYMEAVRDNSTAPIPIAIGQADNGLNAFASINSRIEKVAAFKMLLLAWSSLRAATMMANSGMVLQTPSVQRQALESIAYGYLFITDAEFHEMWKLRHDDENAAKTFRRKGWGRALEIIRLSNANLGKRIAEQYDHLIDIGAHPNVLAIDQMSSYSIEEGAEFGTAEFMMLFGQPFVAFSHTTTFTTYIILMDAVIDIWPERSVECGLIVEKDRAVNSALGFLQDTRRQFDRLRAPK